MSRSDCLPGPGRLRHGLIRPSWGPSPHRAGSPVVPREAVPACPPCYPGGLPGAWQLCWLRRRRPSPNVHGVGAPDAITRLRLGSLHATACGVAGSPVGALVRELGASGYPSHLSRATRAHCQVPGPDFHRQVSRYPRHTDVAALVTLPLLPRPPLPLPYSFSQATTSKPDFFTAKTPSTP